MADGVTALDGLEAVESPMALVAVTVKVYAVPLVSPVTVQVSSSGTVTVEVQVAPSGEAVTV